MRLLFSALAAGAITLSGPAASAQSLPVLDQNPATLRWQRVSTPHFSVLHPVGLEAAAQRTARRLEQVHGVGSATLGVAARPITVVLQNQTTISNGFVTFLPRHAEFFTTPEQGAGLGTVDWLDQLVVHEFRHIGQFDKAREGVGRILVPLLGEGALGVASVGIPPWFFEGDAVGTETGLTRSGRGRIPFFDAEMRANRLAGRDYSYAKAVNGSFRDNVPDWYVLGYFMTSYLKRHHGPAVWDSVLTRYYRFPFYPFSFSRSIRQTTGLRVEELYARSMAELDSATRAAAPARPATPARDFAASATEKVFTEYRYPQYLTDSTVLAVRSGLGDITQLVLLSRHGREQRVFTPGLTNFPEALSAAAGKVVWPEFRYDPRWGQRVYSELKVLNLSTGKVRRLTHRSRYSTAALSPDGRRIVAVQTDASYRHALVLLDAGTGQVQRQLPNPQNDLYVQPRWHPDGQRLVAVTLKPGGKTIELIDAATGAARPLLPVANVNLTNPEPWGEYVLYNSPQSGLDNVWAVNISSGQTYQVTSRPVGAYHATVAPDGRHLAFYDVRPQGARIAEMPLTPAAWTPVAPATSQPDGLYAEALTRGETNAGQFREQLLTADSAKAYPVTPYSPLRHAFNVFSYGLVQSPSGNGLSLGIRSQDYLNTTQAVAGVSYDQTERTAAVFGGLSYQGRYPVLDLEIEHGGRNSGLAVDPNNVLRDRWRYTRLTAGARLPLTLTRSKYLEALSLGVYYLHEQVQDYDLPLRRLNEVAPNRPLNGVQTTLSYARQLKQSPRDVGPRAGQSLLATWRTTPFGRGMEASQVGLLANVYFPGIGKHHSIRLRGAYQWQQQREYAFSPAVFFPRGSGYVNYERLGVASLEYRLPLADTHWELGRVLYVQRFKAVALLDVAQGRNPIRTPSLIHNYRNVGGSVSVVFNVLRLRTPLETGVRVVYDSRRGDFVIQPLVLDIGF